MKYSRYFRASPVFVIALLIGLWASGAFATYRVRVWIEKRFSVEEAQALVGRKVIINVPSREPKTGTIVGYTLWGSPQLEICCTTIERKEDAKVIYGKEAFEGYVTVVDGP